MDDLREPYSQYTHLLSEVESASLVTLNTILVEEEATDAIEKCSFLKSVSLIFYSLDPTINYKGTNPNFHIDLTNWKKFICYWSCFEWRRIIFSLLLNFPV